MMFGEKETVLDSKCRSNTHIMVVSCIWILGAVKPFKDVIILITPIF